MVTSGASVASSPHTNYMYASEKKKVPNASNLKAFEHLPLV